jgi:hypothetical protein
MRLEICSIIAIPVASTFNVRIFLGNVWTGSPLVAHLAHLLRNKAHHEYGNGRYKEESTHVGKSSFSNKRVDISQHSKYKQGEAHRKKYAHGRVQGCNPRYDHKKTHPVVKEPNMAFALQPFFGFYGQVFDAVTVPKNTECNCRRIRIRIR